MPPAPESVLGRIVARKAEDVAARRAARPLASFRGELRPSDRSLRDALTRPATGLILECKKASPSRGAIRPDLDPVALARDYAAAADAISVVVDGPFFQGELAWLAAVRAVVPLPVLCKDFVLEPYQVYEARLLDADAVLLMLSVLDDAAYRACAAAAAAVGLDTLTEVHDEAELERALALDAPIVGVNNRDLKTLAVDLATSERLAPRIPPGRVAVAESGVHTHHDLRRLRGVVDAFLIGTSLVADPVPAEATRRVAYGRVKVCGLTRPEDARAAWEAGATWGGLIHAPKSPRRVDPEQARAVRAAAPLRWAGVFVDADPDAVAGQAAALELSAVQLHGDEDRAYVDALRPRLPDGCEVWKAVRVADRIPPRQATGADRLLLDTYRAGQRGGTGQAFDWGLLAGHPEPDRLIVAGGLGPENAAAADSLGCWALDVNSGVEAAPGEKDPARLAATFAALRGGGRSAATP